MIARLFLLFLTPALGETFSQQYYYARNQRKMGFLTSYLYLAGFGLTYALMRLEGPAWQRLWQKYRPWFAHLLDREYRFADPLRFVLQGLWLLLFNPLARGIQSGVNQGWAKLKEKANTVHGYFNLFIYREILQRVISKKTFSTEVDQLTKTKRRGPLEAGLWLLMGLLVFSLLLLLITQPFSLFAQLVFVLLLWFVALVVRRVRNRFNLLFLIVLSLIVSTRYIWWRYTATLNWNDGKDLTFGLVLLAAETYSWIVLVLGYIQSAWPLHRPVADLPKDITTWPTVDLMIPTYNEGLDVVRPTVYAALGVDWPKDKLRIHLLDDGRRAEFKAFAEELGINYIIRPDGRHAKAGNLNHALGKTDGELIAIFDCDHVPVRSFLQFTVGWFFKDKKLALVQTPHHFFSADPFERNLDHFGEKPNENTLFYGLLQEGNDFWNAAFFCGSCAVMRRDALEEIGGFAVETVTEDAHTALRLHRQGYNSAYLPIPLAAGLATESLSAHIGQRIRWARGMVQIFRTDNPLFGKGLNLFQRLCYANGMIHFLAGIPRMIYLTAPLAFLIFHAYIIYAPVLVILLYVLPHMVHAGLTNSVIQGPYRRSFWGEIYETVLSWYIAVPTTVALLMPKKGLFNVTEKGGVIEKDFFDWRIATPSLIFIALNISGLAFGVWRYSYGPMNEQLTVIITMLWVVYNLIILGGAVAVAVEVRQFRRSHRIHLNSSVTLLAKDGKAYTAEMTDYSTNSIGVQSKHPLPISVGEEVTAILNKEDRPFSFPTQVVRTTSPTAEVYTLGLTLLPLTKQQHIDYVQCTFARSDAWLTAMDKFTLDRPVASFIDVLKLSLSGYLKLGQRLPFPFSWLFNFTRQGLLWLYSFMPCIYPGKSNDKKTA